MVASCGALFRFAVYESCSRRGARKVGSGHEQFARRHRDVRTCQGPGFVGAREHDARVIADAGRIAAQLDRPVAHGDPSSRRCRLARSGAPCRRGRSAATCRRLRRPAPCRTTPRASRDIAEPAVAQREIGLARIVLIERQRRTRPSARTRRPVRPLGAALRAGIRPAEHDHVRIEGWAHADDRAVDRLVAALEQNALIRRSSSTVTRCGAAAPSSISSMLPRPRRNSGILVPRLVITPCQRAGKGVGAGLAPSGGRSGQWHECAARRRRCG